MNIEQTSQREWDIRFLGQARYSASFSKDPSTKTGAVIVRPDHTYVTGYNGFPRGMPDNLDWYADRNEKYARIIHAEENALAALGSSAQGFTLYTWPFFTCDRCAARVINWGITRVVAPECDPERLERWASSFERAKQYFNEAGVEWELITPTREMFESWASIFTTQTPYYDTEAREWRTFKA